MRSLLAALGLALACAPAANADILIYQFQATVTLNNIGAGAFAAAPIGSSAFIQITVETSTVPIFTDANRNVWDSVSGTVLAMHATVDGSTSVVTPNSAPTRARVVNDALLSGGPSRFDQFWMEVPTAVASPDLNFASIILSSIGPGPAVPSSLLGFDWPDDSSELDPASFTNENQMIISRGGPNFLSAHIDSINVLPTPGAIALLSITALTATRRRRP